MAESVVIIPTYNEIENIERMLETVLALAPPFHVLIVDDGSPDGTAAAVKAKQSNNPECIHLLERSGKLGWELHTSLDSGGHWSRGTS